MVNEGKPSCSSSFRIGSNASCRMNASTFFMAASLTREAGGQYSICLQAEAKALSVLAEGGVEPRELLHALQSVRDRVAVHEQGAGRGAGGAVVLEERLQRRDELGAVGLVVADQRRHRVVVERAHLVGMGGEDAEQEPVGARGQVLP